MTAVFDNLMDGTACVTGNAPWKWHDVIADLRMRQADIAHQDFVTVARTLDDILSGQVKGKLYDAYRQSWVASPEPAYVAAGNTPLRVAVNDWTTRPLVLLKGNLTGNASVALAYVCNDPFRFGGGKNP